MSELSHVEFFVAGDAKPQGSKRAIMGPNQRFPSVVESAGQPLKDWRGDVRYAATKVNRRFDGAVAVRLHFAMRRPKCHFGTGRNAQKLKDSSPEHHTKKPDVDKLARAILDALTGVLYRDDSCVNDLLASKGWAIGEPGCFIRVEERETTNG